MKGLAPNCNFLWNYTNSWCVRVCQYCIENPFSLLFFIFIFCFLISPVTIPFILTSSWASHSVSSLSSQVPEGFTKQLSAKMVERDKELGTLLDSGNPSKAFHICVQLKKTFQVQHMHLCCVRKQSCLGWHDCITSSQCHEASFWQWWWPLSTNKLIFVWLICLMGQCNCREESHYTQDTMSAQLTSSGSVSNNIKIICIS